VTASPNLDLVRAIYAALERGDFSSAKWAHPEIEYVHADGLTPGRWAGVAAMADSFQGWLDAWEHYRATADEYRELDDERVLVFVTRSGRGRSSGLELGQMRSKGAHVFHVRDGKVTQLVVYSDHEDALADLGLAPD
jgi:ketosteroid isomerase-like protein